MSSNKAWHLSVAKEILEAVTASPHKFEKRLFGFKADVLVITNLCSGFAAINASKRNRYMEKEEWLLEIVPLQYVGWPLPTADEQRASDCWHKE